MIGKKSVILMILTLCIGAFVFIIFTYKRDAISEHSRIINGMSENDVIDRLGRPTRSERSLRRCENFSDKVEDQEKSIEVVRLIWEEPDAILIVEFDLQEKNVVYKNSSWVFESRGFFEKVLRFLKGLGLGTVTGSP